jgi:hypothetical protein
MTRRSVGLLAILVAVVLVSTSVSAQRITRRIFVAARAAGAPVLDLTAADFQIVENGTKREVTRAGLGKAPMRIVLLVDSSSAMSQMLNPFRAGLNTFIDTLPPEHEVVFVTFGGQTRVRVQPTTDRAALKTAAGRFSSDGGGNAFVDTLLESDRRFLQKVTQWPVFVIVTTDNGDSRVDPRINQYNAFMESFLQRGGSAHGIVIKGPNSSHIADIAENLIVNTGGIHNAVNQPSALEAQLKEIAERLASDHAKMANVYEIDYPSDGKLKQPAIEIGTGRQGVTLQLFPRRPI